MLDQLLSPAIKHHRSQGTSKQERSETAQVAPGKFHCKDSARVPSTKILKIAMSWFPVDRTIEQFPTLGVPNVHVPNEKSSQCRMPRKFPDVPSMQRQGSQRKDSRWEAHISTNRQFAKVPGELQLLRQIEGRTTPGSCGIVGCWAQIVPKGLVNWRSPKKDIDGYSSI